MSDDKILKDTWRQGQKKRSVWGCLFRVFLYLFALVFLAAVVAGFAGFMVYQHVTQPGTPGEEVLVKVPEGASGKAVGDLLAEHALIENELFFRLALKLDPAGGAIKHGRYMLPRGASAKELLAILREGPITHIDPSQLPDELKVTVPEGLTIAQAARAFDRPEAFIRAGAAPARIAELGLDVPNLEGFLFPSTYFFDEKPSEEAVVQRMFETFQEVYGELAAKHPTASQRPMLEIVTVASIVEEEARINEERARIAAVIYNRLEEGMRLQMDCTLQYALDKYGERLLDADKEVDSPYNTYKNTGLPPGPISNPGKASLEAALAPADVDYLYFVSNADGKTHTFSSNIRDHNRAVRRFRQLVAPQRQAEQEP